LNVVLVLFGMSLLAHAAVPSAPTDCTAVAVSSTAANTTLDISWNDTSTNETLWKIQYSTNDWATSSVLSVGGASTTTGTGRITYTWKLAALNATYRIRVVAANAAGSSVASDVASVGTFAMAAPFNFSATAVDPFNVVMNWDEASTTETGFAVEMKDGTNAWAYLGTLGANSLFVNPSSLTRPLGTFLFRVRAFKGTAPSTPDSPASANVSAYSNTFEIDAGAYPLAASAVPCQAVINLSWPNIRNEDGYQIQYKKTGDADYSVLDWTAKDVTTYQVKSPYIQGNTSYSFIVQPYASMSILGDSSVASALVDVLAAMTSQPGLSGTPGSPFAHTFTHESDATVSSRTLTGIPTGLTFDNATGELTGVFPPIGNYVLDYAVRFTSGSTLTQKFYIRVRPPAGPPAVAAVIPAWSGEVGDYRDTVLADAFSDPEEESAVRVSTSLGDMDFVLFNTATPATVTNFMNYVNLAKYTDVAFHRSLANFVIQAGGFKGTGVGNHFTSVVTSPPVVNEPGIGNERGTVSMAKLGGDPDSATSQFFVSVADNRSNLDFQNGGFTVFGRVAGHGMEVADAISSLPTGSYNLLVDNAASATTFDDIPVNDTSFPAVIDQTKLVKMNSVTPIPTLSYRVTGNTQPTVVSASIIGGKLHLLGLAEGQSSLTIAATDLDNLTTTQTVTVNLAKSHKSLATVKLGGLAATYSGSAKIATATTTPAGLAVNFTYNGSSVAPTQAGSYTVFATINNANYQGNTTGTLVISKALATAKLGALSAVYNGTAKTTTVTTTPLGLPVQLSYNGSINAPTTAGTYAVVGTINDANYQGSVTGSLVISKATATVSLGSLAQTYDGAAKAATATTTPARLAMSYTYNGSAIAPTYVGKYAVVGTIDDINYQGRATGNLVISKATAALSLGGLAVIYDGAAKAATVTTTPAGLPVKVTYNGLAVAPKNAGSYAVVATINDVNYQGRATGTLVIAKAPATAVLGKLAATFNGLAKSATAVTTPAGLPVKFTYNGLATAPKNAGNYAVLATINHANYVGSVADTLVISKALATVKLGRLAATYDGTAKPVTATTTPAGLAVTVTYNGTASVPINAGTYEVVATVNHANYQGSATGSLVIAP
jgi:cyclophilin family peptidyl-prolyl cis-trans isomerase